MAFPAYPNAISFSQIQAGFFTSANSFSDLYQKQAGPVFTGQVGYPYGTATNVPTSGTISMANFSGATPHIPVSQVLSYFTNGSYSWTVPASIIGDVTISAIGAGGGGAGWPSFAGGGGGGGGSLWVGRPTAGTVINFTVGAGGAPGPGGVSGAGGGTTTFGSPGSPWYITATGGEGGIATGGGPRAAGGTGNYGTGGAGASRYASPPATNAVNLGGGGGTNDGNSAAPGNGAGYGGGLGGYGRATGQPAGGGGGGGDRGTGGYGANGAVIIVGTW